MVTPQQTESGSSAPCAHTVASLTAVTADVPEGKGPPRAGLPSVGEYSHEPRDQNTTSRDQTWTPAAQQTAARTNHGFFGSGLSETLPSEPAPSKRPDAQTSMRRIDTDCETPTHRGEAFTDCPDVHTSSEIYAKRFSSPAGRYLLDVQTTIVRDMLRPWPGASVLDIGGGHGQISTPLAADGYRVTALASTPSAFGRPASQGSGKITCVSGDLLRPPFADKSFDVVTAIRLMAHMKEWPQLLEASCRIARTAVIVDFAIPGGANRLADAFFPAKKWLEGDTRRFAVIDAAAVSKAFADSGFRIERSTGQFVFPMAVHRALNTPIISKTIEATARAIPFAASIANPVLALAVPL